MKKLTLIILISGLTSLLISLLYFIFSNLNFIKKDKFINILENIIKIIVKNRDLELLDSVFKKIISLKRVLKIELFLENGLRIVKKNLPPKKKNLSIHSIQRELYENNRYLGIIKLDIIL